MTGRTGYFLLDNPNRHAPERSNGIRFHGHPTRTTRPRLIGVHTTESAFDLLGADTGAEGVARFQSHTDRPSSYHRIVDRDSTVVCLPDEATAFGIGNLNSPTLHLSFAMRAADWADPAKAKAADPMLRRGAAVAAEWSRRYRIPLVRVTRTQAFGTGRGLIAHGVADPARRSDPGAFFPWTRFLQLAADVGAPTRPALSEEDDTMRLIRNSTEGDRRYGAIALVGGPHTSFDHIEQPELAGALAASIGPAKDINAREFDLTEQYLTTGA